MKTLTTLIACSLGLALGACHSADGDDARTMRIAGDGEPGTTRPLLSVEDDDDEEVIGADEIPLHVREAALGAVPGLVIEEAEVEDGGDAYCVHGTAAGVFTEVEVSSAGEVLEIEQGPDDEDDDDEEGDDDDGDDEEEIALDQVPQAAKDAALAELPGFVIETAEKETENGQVLYGLEGTVNGEPYEVEVTADGQVIEVEKEDDEDDD